MANTIQHGVNITANDVKDLVESGTDAAGRKTWQDLYGSSALSYQAQNDALLKSYGDIIAEAYKSSLQQQNALYDFGLSANDTHDLRSIARQDMLAAYDTYLGNYQQAQQEIAEAYQTQKSTWDQALTDESTNFAKLYNYATQYYTDVLSGATWTGNDLDNPKFVEQGKEAVQDGYEQKTESLIDRYGLQWLTATNEDDTVRQLTNEELMNKLFDADNNITELGREFYDMVFNMDLSDGYTDAEGNPITTFDAWLSDTDSDLYTWAHSPDTFNYTRQGTKLGTAKTWAGLESDDGKFQAYQTIEGAIDTIDTILQKSRAKYDYVEDLKNWTVKNYAKLDKKTSAGVVTDEVYGDDETVSYEDQKTIQEWYNNLRPMIDAYNKDSLSIYNEVIDKIKTLDSDLYEKYEDDFDSLYNEYGNLLSDLSEAQISYLTYELKRSNIVLPSSSDVYPYVSQMTGADARTYQKFFVDSYDYIESDKFKKELEALLEDFYSDYENSRTVSGR